MGKCSLLTLFENKKVNLSGNEVHIVLTVPSTPKIDKILTPQHILVNLDLIAGNTLEL